MVSMRQCSLTALLAVGKPILSGRTLIWNDVDCSGQPDNPGLIYLTTQELFERCAALTEKKVDIKLSFLEIYNETIRDLLVPTEESKPLLLREDSQHRISVPGLTTATPVTVNNHFFSRLTLGRRGDESHPPGERKSHILSNRGECNFFSFSCSFANQCNH